MFSLNGSDGLAYIEAFLVHFSTEFMLRTIELHLLLDYHIVYRTRALTVK